MNRFEWKIGDIFIVDNSSKNADKEDIKDITKKVLKDILNNLNLKKT